METCDKMHNGLVSSSNTLECRGCRWMLSNDSMKQWLNERVVRAWCVWCTHDPAINFDSLFNLVGRLAKIIYQNRLLNVFFESNHFAFGFDARSPAQCLLWLSVRVTLSLQLCKFHQLCSPCLVHAIEWSARCISWQQTFRFSSFFPFTFSLRWGHFASVSVFSLRRVLSLPCTSPV